MRQKRRAAAGKSAVPVSVFYCVHIVIRAVRPSPRRHPSEKITSLVISSEGAAEVEKSPAEETARYIYAPAHSPAAAHRREIPRNRNENKRTRITDQANTLNATVIARSATRDAAISRKGRRTWRTRTLYFYRGGFLRCVRTVALTPVEMTL